MKEQKIWYAQGVNKENAGTLISKPAFIVNADYYIQKNKNKSLSGIFSIESRILNGSFGSSSTISLHEKDVKEIISMHSKRDTLDSLLGKSINVWGEENNNRIKNVKAISLSSYKIEEVVLNCSLINKTINFSLIEENSSLYKYYGNPLLITSSYFELEIEDLKQRSCLNKSLLDICNTLEILKPSTIVIENGQEYNHEDNFKLVTRPANPLPRKIVDLISEKLNEYIEAKNLDMGIKVSYNKPHINDSRFYLINGKAWKIDDLNYKDGKRDSYFQEVQLFNNETDMLKEFNNTMFSRTDRTYMFAPLKIDLTKGKIERKDGKPLQDGPIFLFYENPNNVGVAIRKIKPENIFEEIQKGVSYKGRSNFDVEFRMKDICQEINPKLELVK